MRRPRLERRPKLLSFDELKKHTWYVVVIGKGASMVVMGDENGWTIGGCNASPRLTLKDYKFLPADITTIHTKSAEGYLFASPLEEVSEPITGDQLEIGEWGWIRGGNTVVLRIPDGQLLVFHDKDCQVTMSCTPHQHTVYRLGPNDRIVFEETDG